MKRKATGSRYKHIDLPATGAEIKRQMNAKGISTRDMSNALGVTFQAVYGYISGKRLPSISHFYMLSQVLNTNIEDLIVIKAETIGHR